MYRIQPACCGGFLVREIWTKCSSHHQKIYIDVLRVYNRENGNRAPLVQPSNLNVNLHFGVHSQFSCIQPMVILSFYHFNCISSAIFKHEIVYFCWWRLKMGVRVSPNERMSEIDRIKSSEKWLQIDSVGSN